MTTTASGPITTTEERLKTLLSSLSAFRAWVGATTSAAAAEHIYLEALPRSFWQDDAYTLEWLKSIRPFAQIWTDEINGFQVTNISSQSSPTSYTSSGVLVVRFEANVTHSIRHDIEEVDRLFKNALGDIIVELMADNSDDCLAIRNIQVTHIWRTSPEEMPAFGDAQEGIIEIQWGAAS